MPAPQASSRIFISYRREDSSGHVLALLPSLRKHFGDSIFKDTDNIPPGEDFVKFIKRELDSCSVLLAIIGRDWLNAQDPRLNVRRLDKPDDYLRVEVSTALRSERIRVIPVLVERATMPTAADLPADLAELTHRNAFELSDVRWESDVNLLVQAIQRACAATADAVDVRPDRPELRDLQKRRNREIAQHLAAAREAFEAGDYETTLLDCEKALLLDPHGSEALELLDRTRKTIDQQKIEAWLRDARQALGQGDVGGATDFIDQALSIDPAGEAALALRQELLALRRERERDRERTRVMAAAIERARASLEEEDFDAVVRHTDDALALKPQSVEAQDLRARAVAALDERRQHRRHAQQAVAAAREQFGAGQHDAALQRLREFRPAHALVSLALAELEKDAEAAARQAAALREADATRREQEAAARRREEAERAAVDERAAAAERAVAAERSRAEAMRGALARGRSHLERQDYPAAIREAEALLGLDPRSADGLQLRQAALEGRDAREARERAARAAEERARQEARRAEAERQQAEARERDERERLKREADASARAQAEKAEATRKAEARAREQAEAERARVHEREMRVAHLLAEAEAALAARSYKTAVRRSTAVLGLAPDNDRAQVIRTAATRELDAAGPERWSTRRYAVVGGAAAVMLTAAIGLWQYRQSDDVASTGQSPQSSSAPAAPTPTEPRPTEPQPTEPQPTDRPQATSAAPPAPVDTTVTTPAVSGASADELREQKLRALRGAGRKYLQLGSRTRALSTVAEGLQLAPADPELRSMLGSLLDEAQRTAGRAKTAASSVDAAQLAKATFQDGLRLEQEGSQHHASGRQEPATRSFWQAEERFVRAEREARSEQARLKTIDENKERTAAADSRGTAGAATKPPPPSAQPTAPAEQGKVAENLPPPDRVAPTASNPAAAAPAASRVEQEREIAARLRQYTAGYNELNAAVVKQVYPSLQTDLRKLFLQYDSYKLDLKDIKIELAADATSATVSCAATHDSKRKGSDRDTYTTPQTFTLRKRDDAWVVVSIDYGKGGRR